MTRTPQKGSERNRPFFIIRPSRSRFAGASMALPSGFNAGESIHFRRNIRADNDGMARWNGQSQAAQAGTAEGLLKVANARGCATSSSRFNTLARPMRTSQAQAGHCCEEFPTQLQSGQRYAEAKGICCMVTICMASPEFVWRRTMRIWVVEHIPYLLGWMPCPGVELFVDGGQTPANLLLTGVKIPVQTIGH